MQIAVLAGGLATRLYPITKKIPKSMVSVAGKPFLEHQINLFKKNNIFDIVLCVGYLSAQIKDYFGNGKKFGVNIKYSQETEKLDTGGALKNAKNFLDKEFFVIYGDSYLLIDYQKVYRFFKKHKKLGLMNIYKNNNKYELSRVLVDGIYIKKYQKDPPPKGAKYMEVALNIFKKEILNTVGKKVFPISDYFDILTPRRELIAFITKSKKQFYEMGCASGLKEARNFLKNYGISS